MTAGFISLCGCSIERDMIEQPDLLLSFRLCHSHARVHTVRLAAEALQAAMQQAFRDNPPRPGRRA